MKILKSSLIPLISGIFLMTSSAQTLQDCYNPELSTCPQPVDINVPDPAKMLSWGQQERVIGFRNTHRMYEGDVFKAPSQIKNLSIYEDADNIISKIQYQANHQTYKIEDYIKNQSATGILILKNNKIVYEYYGDGNTPSSLWTSRSVAKSIVTILIGIAVKEGKIESTDTLVSQYIPELKGSHWENVTIEQLMQHTSGITWNEDYADPDSDFAVMTACEALTNPFPCVFELVKSRPSSFQPGEVWSYNTGGAWLVGVLLERATGDSIAKYLEKNIWQPYGMEQDGIWQALVKDKISMGGHGFHANLRDWGRFGLFVLNNGELANGQKLLPENWIKKSTNWSTAKDSISEYTPQGQYGYQWWFQAVEADEDAGFSPRETNTSNETFWALGIYGQSIAINPKENLVVVQWSAQAEAEDMDIINEQIVFFNAISNAFHH